MKILESGTKNVYVWQGVKKMLYDRRLVLLNNHSVPGIRLTIGDAFHLHAALLGGPLADLGALGACGAMYCGELLGVFADCNVPLYVGAREHPYRVRRHWTDLIALSIVWHTADNVQSCGMTWGNRKALQIKAYSVGTQRARIVASWVLRDASYSIPITLLEDDLRVDRSSKHLEDLFNG